MNAVVTSPLRVARKILVVLVGILGAALSPAWALQTAPAQPAPQHGGPAGVQPPPGAGEPPDWGTSPRHGGHRHNRAQFSEHAPPFSKGLPPPHDAQPICEAPPPICGVPPAHALPVHVGPFLQEGAKREFDSNARWIGNLKRNRSIHNFPFKERQLSPEEKSELRQQIQINYAQ